jgi:tRNA pseudouridine32 synthase/23S rRNA pseudouridine746 synthase
VPETRRAAGSSSTRKRERHTPRRQRQQQSWPQWAQSQHAQLLGERKALSHALMARVQGSYVTRDVFGRELRLLHVYNQRLPPDNVFAAPSSPITFPAGTGDCCLPKLLHAAAQKGLTPVSAVEFWYGR